MAPRLFRHAAYAGVLATLALVVGSTSASAGRSDPPGQDGNHCINAFGVDYNTVFRVRDQFRTFECRTIRAGEHWIPFLFWATDDGLDSVYPAGEIDFTGVRPLTISRPTG